MALFLIEKLRSEPKSFSWWCMPTSQEYYLTFSRMKYVPGDEIPWSFTLWCWVWVSSLTLNHLPVPRASFVMLSVHAGTTSIMSTWQLSPTAWLCLYCTRVLLISGSIHKACTCLTGHLGLAHRYLSKRILPNPVLTNRMWVISWKSIEKKIPKRRLWFNSAKCYTKAEVTENSARTIDLIFLRFSWIS